ncbi:MAG: hypothetical protein IT201_04465 [Thermoleophilia bacterium]|nr:hypothetical protein [Thermoleophilia bacterium]
MARRRTLFLAAGVALAGAALLRRRGARRRERVDLYFADGSMISLEQGGIEADRLLPLAHDVLFAARGPSL